ncbi:peptidyl-prolyl cis-trans isomerase FKBP10-like [Tachysurus fulvidraco]|uniref:peptidyl-prolyl cis-trans isomerase FKBP10-like n=1 Tax=Tachysurus fulvidraco TaxID=1234273 RepID=UPI001FEE2C35|nr:peptidyl-prolyl cis-trans isomerase FKBP10-like [Tachysurus fulvidraco]
MLCMSERRKIIMPPHLAYGHQGGKEIPVSAGLVFHIHVIYFHNPKDSVKVDVTFRQGVCNETSQVNDYIQYYYNCTQMDGTLLFTS